jgi:hypothetical protein
MSIGNKTKSSKKKFIAESFDPPRMRKMKRTDKFLFNTLYNQWKSKQNENRDND